MYMLYGRSNPRLVYYTDTGPREILSMEGAQQGCPGSMYGFCIAAKEAYDVIASHAVGFAAYADDGNIICKKDEVQKLAEVAKDALASFGVELQPAKCKILNLRNETEPVDVALGSTTIPVVSDGLVAAGIPVGTDEFVAKFADSRVEEVDEELRALSRLLCNEDSHQAVYFAAKYCSFAKLPWLGRAIAPDRWQQAREIAKMSARRFALD